MQGCPILAILLSLGLEALDRAIRQEKETKGTKIEKGEIKPSLFISKVIAYVENPIHLQNNPKCLVPAADAWNPSYLGSYGSRPAQAKKLVRPHLNQ
jgi:hypothetical protein